MGGQQARRVIRRALRLHCPSCGSGGIFSSWLSMRERCPLCHWWFERGDGYFVGAMSVNMFGAEMVPAAFYIALLVFTWPHPPWAALTGVAVGLAVLTPLATYPFSRMLWLAIDLIVRPIQPEEYDRKHALD